MFHCNKRSPHSNEQNGALLRRKNTELERKKMLGWQNGTLRVGYVSSSPPYVFPKRDGEWAGVAVEMFLMLAKSLQLTLVIEKSDSYGSL